MKLRSCIVVLALLGWDGCPINILSPSAGQRQDQGQNQVGQPSPTPTPTPGKPAGSACLTWSDCADGLVCAEIEGVLRCTVAPTPTPTPTPR